MTLKLIFHDLKMPEEPIDFTPSTGIRFCCPLARDMMLQAEARSAPLLEVEEGSGSVMDASLVQILDFMYKVPWMVLFSAGIGHADFHAAGF